MATINNGHHATIPNEANLTKNEVNLSNIDYNLFNNVKNLTNNEDNIIKCAAFFPMPLLVLMQGPTWTS